MARPRMRKDGETVKKNNERGKERGKKRGWGEVQVYNWCTERAVFMLQGFRDVNGKVVLFSPYQTKAMDSYCMFHENLIYYNFSINFETSMNHE